MLDTFTCGSLLGSPELLARLADVTPRCMFCRRPMRLIEWAPYVDSQFGLNPISYCSAAPYAYICENDGLKDQHGHHCTHMIHWLDIENLLNTPEGKIPKKWWK